MEDIKTLKIMIRHLLALLDRKQISEMIGMMFIILFGSGFELLGVSAMLPFIQSLLAPKELMNKPYIASFVRLFHLTDPDKVVVLVGVGIVIIYLIKNIYLSFSAYMQVSYSNKTKKQLSVQMLKMYMNRPYSFFVENGSGVIIRGVSNDIQGVYHVISNIFKLAAEGFVVVAVTTYLFVVDSLLAIGVLAIGIICMLVLLLGLKKKLTKLSYAYREASAILGKYVANVNAGIKDIMVFNRRGLFLDGYENAYEQSNIAETKSEFAGLLPERIIEASCISGIIIMVLIRLNQGVDANDFVPKMAVFAMGAFRLLPSISRITGYFSVLIYARPMLEATYENYEAAKEYFRNNEATISYKDDTEDKCFKNEISVRNVVWKYPQAKEAVLNGLELTIRKGEAIGIVGESGSGKSTLADLILRLYKPQSGGIYMDGIDISTIPNAWSRILTYVPQSVFLMDESIRDNVTFGNPNEDDNLVWDALRKASLGEYVKSLPDGLDTIVGERGVKFSGGQRQRLAIARALYINPQIMILDEATSALDNETEEAVMEAIDSLAGSITLIIIAHRITTLKNCDKIYEIVNGEAVLRKKEDIVHF